MCFAWKQAQPQNRFSGGVIASQVIAEMHRREPGAPEVFVETTRLDFETLRNFEI
jgi:hypothetical protein